MKKCIDYEALIPEYLDGELEASLCSEFEAHVEECPSCKKALEEMRKLLADISQTAYPVPDELKSGVMSRIEAEASLKKKKNIIRTLGAVAACFVIAVGVIAVRPYLGENIMDSHRAESLEMAEAPEASQDYELLENEFLPTVNMNDAEKEEPEIYPESAFSKNDVEADVNDDGSLENIVGASPVDGELPESADDENAEDVTGDPGSCTLLDEILTGSVSVDIEEENKGSENEEIDCDYGALFMTRGAAWLAQQIDEEE